MHTDIDTHISFPHNYRTGIQGHIRIRRGWMHKTADLIGFGRRTKAAKRRLMTATAGRASNLIKNHLSKGQRAAAEEKKANLILSLFSAVFLFFNDRGARNVCPLNFEHTLPEGPSRAKCNPFTRTTVCRSEDGTRLKGDKNRQSSRPCPSPDLGSTVSSPSSFRLFKRFKCNSHGNKKKCKRRKYISKIMTQVG